MSMHWVLWWLWHRLTGVVVEESPLCGDVYTRCVSVWVELIGD